MRNTCLTLLLISMVAPAARAQLSADWMVTAAANTPGVGGTYWRTDLSLHNPHEFNLAVKVVFLPSNNDNRQAEFFWVDLYPWETVNLWDVLGSDGFDDHGTGAMLVYADTALPCSPIEDCQFLVTSRSYTLDGWGYGGEFGQTISGADAYWGVDWQTLGYTAGILNDDQYFRCNVGVASWSADWTVVAVDVQDSVGNIVATHHYEIPPFGHVQRRLETRITGGSLVFYLVEGPDNALVFPYASVVDQVTGDPSYQPALASVIGVSQPKNGKVRPVRPPYPEPSREIDAPEKVERHRRVE